MKPENKLQVVYLVDCAGISAGTEKPLKQSLANAMIERGIVKLKGEEAETKPKKTTKK